MILIGLGSSLPFCGRPPQDLIGLAFAALDAHFGLARRSATYSFPAWPDPSDPPFVNAAAVLAAAPPPAELLARLHAIEAAFGRTRARKNAPRTLDLDLLAYDGLVQPGPPALPHPGLETRAFVLVPLAEIAPGFRSPGSGQTVRALLARLNPRHDAAHFAPQRLS